MKKIIAAAAMLAASACASQPDTTPQAATLQADAQGYFRLPIGEPGAAPDPGKIGEQMAHGEMYCRDRGQTAETGFVTGPNGAFIRFRCIDQPPATK